ncbi:hypothetical protein O181_011606 [Austropuccinia psidii MF-1]|uniref:Integrase zinc-binding domain-containing protein n=1 Tax=Austropuccinia psidii MF-1 TaxID=1389203 RepID=A0A9Q3BW27_9BASI|nr:hypothetical protein [Austropuccinia psidii MF-1]
MGHMSEDRTKEGVASTDWWPKWEQELSEYINSCERCQKENRKYGKKYGLIQNIEEHKHPWETINMACVTGLVPGGKKNSMPSKKKTTTQPDIVEVKDSPGPVEKIITARRMRLNGKDQRQYLVRFRNHRADKEKWLAEDAIPDGNLHLRRLRASRRT